MDRLNKDHKVRGTENNFKTEDYVKELKEILKHQDLNEELCDQIIEMVSRRRRYDQGQVVKNHQLLMEVIEWWMVF